MLSPYPVLPSEERLHSVYQQRDNYLRRDAGKAQLHTDNTPHDTGYEHLVDRYGWPDTAPQPDCYSPREMLLGQLTLILLFSLAILLRSLG